VDNKKKSGGDKKTRAPKKGIGEWTPTFLMAIRNMPNIRVACLHAGVSRSEAYRLRSVNPEFEQEWAEAWQDGLDAIEAKLMARAMKSDTIAAIFLLKNRRPEIFGENVNVNVSGSLTIDEVRQGNARLNDKLAQIEHGLGERKIAVSRE
jgi:hypothetical protein